jgi:hypothetical protein
VGVKLGLAPRPPAAADSLALAARPDRTGAVEK